MEQLDEAFARTVHGLMQRPEGARLFSARELDASRMTALLRSLRLLVTSRFHAAVLSMEACVPQIAVGHDMRLRTLYQDLGLADEWFFDPKETRTADLFAGLHAAACRLLENPALQREALRDGYAAHRDRADMNRKLLAQFVQGSAATDREEGATCVA
jgi:polysaccharide pyruvyl transferase WcaK-like protein